MKEREYAYYQWSTSDLLHHFDVDKNEGLSERKASFRILETGLNTLEKIKETNFLLIFLRQFVNFFVLILFIAAIISYIIDGLLQSLILVLIILLNVTIGFIQEYKAEKALGELKKNFRTKVKVLRDGKLRIIDSEEITLGDIISIEAGDKIPADIRLIENNSLSINESSLTGESLPVYKKIEVLDYDTSLADQTNMIFASTVAVSGHGCGVVVAVADKTEFGKLAKLTGKEEEETSLEKQMKFVSKILCLVSFIIAIIIFVLGLSRGMDIGPLLTFSIALFVAAVPESLPTVIVLTLAIGVSRLAQKKAIVRRLSAIETLGTVNIIATDKTGTLTDNNLKVEKISLFKDSSMIDFESKNEMQSNTKILEMFENAIACSNINLNDEKFIGDPLEVAIADEAKLFRKGIILRTNNYRRLFEIPFESSSQFMAVHVFFAGKKELIAKGSPEKILSFCHVDAKERKKILQKNEELCNEGLKTIAICKKPTHNANSSSLSGMSFIGIFSLVDEPSVGIKEALSSTILAGIRPIIITGDHAETARFVAKKIGLDAEDSEIIIGSELKHLSFNELKKLLKKVKIFARVAPEDKINIVKALQKSGYSVAVTGDGINDAPALLEANVGVAMGIKGTDAARESADIILSDDNYKTILSAIEYGRTIYDTIRKAVIFLISGSFAEIFLIAFALIFSLPLPLLTIQILWINMVTDSLPAMALAFETPSRKVLKEKPRSTKDNSLKSSIIYSFVFSIFIFFIAALLYLWGLNKSIILARTLVFTYCVMAELVFCFSLRSKERIWENVRSFFENKFLLLTIFISFSLQLLLYLKPFSKVFSITKLDIVESFVLVLSIITTFCVAEISHFFLQRDREALINETKSG